jgi:hypothetical protein
MRWRPLSDFTMPDSSPTLSATTASSNGFCMAPGPKSPRSPPALAEEQSLSFAARSANVTLPLLIASRCPARIARASASVRLLILAPSGSFHDAGRREPDHLTSCTTQQRQSGDKPREQTMQEEPRTHQVARTHLTTAKPTAARPFLPTRWQTRRCVSSLSCHAVSPARWRRRVRLSRPVHACRPPVRGGPLCSSSTSAIPSLTK